MNEAKEEADEVASFFAVASEVVDDAVDRLGLELERRLCRFLLTISSISYIKLHIRLVVPSISSSY